MMRGYKINKDDSTTLKIGKMNIVGNMMPEKWFKELTTESGRPYFPAILTLAEAVYWYKPIIVKNPQTYEFVGYRKKFKSDMWQINYESIAKKYGMTKRQIQDATSYLVNDINIFYRELRKVSIKGRKLPNVPFVDINTKKLAEITYYRNSDEDVTCVTSQRDTSHVSKGYITETTTETRLKKEEVKEEKEEEEEEEPTREQLKEEVEDLESSLKKVMADFDNYRKRMNKEKKRIRKIAAEDLVTDLLEVLDDFERALEEDTEIEEDGVRMIYEKFYRTLSDHGLEEIEAEDEKFDPMYHECIQSLEKEDVEKDKIIEEYQKGYKLKDKVIRPAKVVVAK